MESIKANLLKNLEDISVKFDHQDGEDQVITLNSTYQDYEMSVEVIATTKEEFEPGNYHAEWGQTEGSSFYYEISSVTIEAVYIFKDGGDADFTITKEEIENSIKY